jgi:serine/threonine-protein kinase
VLFTAGIRGDDASIMVQSLPRGPKKVVQRGGYHGRYLPSGHVVYMHEGTLFAVPLDLGRLEPTGPPAPVLEGVIGNVGGTTGGAQFAFSERGTLVFLPGQGGGKVPIQWMDENGKTEPLRTLAGNYFSIRFSPDGQRLAMGLGEGSEQDVWVYEWGRDRMSRLTLAPGADASPVWTPDGRWIAFSSTRADKATANLYWQRADGTGEAERLTESKNPQGPASWHPRGKFLAFHEPTTANRDIWILPMEGDEASGWKPGKPAAFLISPFFETDAAFSPDGRWLAYSSEEPGRFEVYVRPFPGPGGQWQVSEGGGRFPTWSRNRKELFYRTPESTLMVATYAAEGDSFRAEKPRKWSPGLAPPLAPFNGTFDLHPDGQRFAVLKAAEQRAEERRDHVVLIQNFFEELRRLSPVGKR